MRLSRDNTRHTSSSSVFSGDEFELPPECLGCKSFGQTYIALYFCLMPVSNKNFNFDTIIVKHELQNLIQGNGRIGKDCLIETTTHYLRTSKITSTGFEKSKYTKEQETEDLISY